MLSAKAQLQNRFGASVAEVDHHELWQRCALTAAFVAREAREAEELAARAERWLGGQEWVLVSSRARARLARGLASVARMTERMRRVNEAVRAVVAEAVGELKDPRIGHRHGDGRRRSRPTCARHASTSRCSATSARSRRDARGLESAHGVLQGARRARAAG